MNYQPLQLHTRVVLNKREPAWLKWSRVLALVCYRDRFAFHRDQKQERITRK
jgi:hypothetical protein